MDETPSPPGATRRERERLRHRAEILEAARKVVEAKGLAGLTVEEVAREAEFAVGSIYRHFRSKDEMVELLVVHLAEPLCEEIEALAAADGPFEAQLERLVRTVHEHLVEDRPLLQAFYAAAGPVPSEGTEAGDRLRAMRCRIVESAAQVLRNGQRQGFLVERDPMALALALLALLSGALRWSAYTPLPEVDLPRLLLQQFLDGARRR